MSWSRHVGLAQSQDFCPSEMRAGKQSSLGLSVSIRTSAVDGRSFKGPTREAIFVNRASIKDPIKGMVTSGTLPLALSQLIIPIILGALWVYRALGDILRN